MAAAALAVVLMVGFLLWRWVDYNRWLRDGADNLDPFAVVLVERGQPRAELPRPDRDGVLVSAVGEGRLVQAITRSDYWEGAWRCFAKVHLVTHKPGEENTQRPLKLLVEMSGSGAATRVTQISELALP